ncbi:MAG TPA: SurA N-terminal domain-containing protein [Prolixibacteraceae bacterium]|nr:SurA N-terminal domain-containing protein [Prolixibacteraceae bacterium]
MATLQKIRNQGGLMVAIVIGLALGAFILGDMLKSGSNLMKPSQMEIAEIDGESVQYPDFQKKTEELSEIYKMNTRKTQIDEATWEQIREQVWQAYLQENIIGKATENLGISVSSDELFDLVQGNNPHPIIQQLFKNQETGQVDKSSILQFLKSLETNATAQQKSYWLYIESQIRLDRLRTKYTSLVSKGLYVTSDEAKQSLESKDKNADFQYLALNYSTVSDSAVKVSESDLNDYYSKHKDQYKQEKTRKIEYITFDVLPSDLDILATEKWLNDSKEEFAKITDNAQYINVNSETPFDPGFSKKEDLSPEIAEWAFNAQPGDFYGPYKENNEYKLAKVDQFKMLPDSVQASHILINPQTVGSVEKTQALVDSIKKLIDNGASFSELALKYSEDPGSASKGGDLGWFNRKQMVPEFEEVAFSGEVNKVYVARTRFGFHLIKPTKKGKETKQVRLAILARKIEPSTETYQKIYSETSKFAGENQTYEAFTKSVIDQKLNKKIANLKETDREVAGLETSRPLVRAAFTADKGDLLVNNEGSTIFEFGNKFVIGVLTNATEEGISTFEEAKIRVDLAVRKEKKAQMLASKLKDAASGQSSDLGSVAAKLSTNVKEASGINFTSFSIPGIGFEPAVIGTVCSLTEGKISAPIQGNNGVYLAKVTSFTINPDNDMKGEKTRLAQSLSYRAGAQVFETLKKTVDIEDKRAKFY